MYEGLNSPNIHTPKTLGEFSNTILHYPNAFLFANSSAIMSIKDSYPMDKSNGEIIYLGDIDELHHFLRNDRYAEFGAMVNLNEILNAGKLLLPQVLLDTIEQIACQTIRERISIGGCLCTKNFRSPFSSTLLLLETSAEVRYLKKKRLHSKWFPLSRIYDKNGALALPESGLLSRIRIGIQQFSFQYFKKVDTVDIHPDCAVAVSFVCNFEQFSIAMARIALTYPSHGFCSSRDLDGLFTGLQLPLDENKSNNLLASVMEYIDVNFDHLSPLQTARTKGILYDLVVSLNQKAISPPSESDKFSYR